MLLGTTLAFGAGKGWETDYNTAIAKAKATGKPVLVEFTGSDWCPPCKMMEKKVFSKSAFIKAASKDFVLLVLDFPRSDRALAKANEPYAEKYGVTGFPSVVILDPSGKKKDLFIASQYPSIDGMLAKVRASKS